MKLLLLGGNGRCAQHYREAAEAAGHVLEYIEKGKLPVIKSRGRAAIPDAIFVFVVRCSHNLVESAKLLAHNGGCQIRYIGQSDSVSRWKSALAEIGEK